MEKRWLSVDQVRQYIPVSRATIDRWVNHPDYAHVGFPQPFVIEGRIFFDAELVQGFMKRYYATK